MGDDLPRVDMAAAAVSGRLREMARLLDQRGFVSKGPDMSPAAVTQRLWSMAALSDMCRRLAPLGPRLRSLP